MVGDLTGAGDLMPFSSKIVAGFISALAVAAGGFAQQAAEPVTSLADAVAAAISDNPGLRAQRASEDVARADLDFARSQDNLRIDLSASGGYQQTDTNNPFSFTEGERRVINGQVTASKPIWTSGRVPSAIRSAAASLDSAAAGTEATRQDVVLRAVTAFADLILARQTREIRRSNLALSGRQRQAAEDRFSVGEVTRTDVSIAVAREEGARAALSVAEAGVSGAEAAFVEVVGRPAGVLGELPSRPVLPEAFESALLLSEQNNPSIAAALSNLEAAEQAVRSRAAALGPQVSIVGRATAAETWDDRIKDTSVSLLGQATIPLYDGDQVRSQTRAARARRDQAQAQLDSVRRQIVRDLATSWASYSAAERAILASRAQVEAAEIAYDGAQQELAVGQRTTLDVLTTEQDLFDAQLALATAERDAFVAAYRVLAVMGGLTEDAIMP